ncbi:MAG: protein kinase [Vicinamibacterales bacterium]
MSKGDSPADPMIGRTFSQYEIVATLGGGGMGVVYKARDMRLSRYVALKFLPSQWSHDDAAKQRFVREAQAASATNHRNICVVHNIEESADGRLFIVMAYYEGVTLKHRLASGALPVADAIDIGIEIAEGLAKAHSQGVVHRDIKPGNLMVTDDGVKILDFGLAKFADALQLTAPGSTIGTYAYMSPEQARGEEADERSDVWALGIVMFEMLTGAPPFRGAYPEATFHAIKHEPLPALRAARPDVPEPLERIVMRALDKDSATRYQSARELARDLRVLAGRSVPIELRTETLPALAERRTRAMARMANTVRRRVGLVLGVAAAVLTAVGVGGYYWLARPIERIRVAVAPVANHTGVVDLDRYRLALTASLLDELAESPKIRVVPYLRMLEMVRPFSDATTDLSGSDAVHAIATASGAPFVVVPTLAYRDRDASWLMQIQIKSAETGTTVASYETAPVNSALSAQAAFRLVIAAANDVQGHFNAHGGGSSAERPAAGRFRDPEAARQFAEGLDAYQQLEYQRAANAFAASAKIDPQRAMTQAWASRVLWLLSMKNDALAFATRAKALVAGATQKGDVAFVDAVLAESQGDLELAERAYQALASVDPEDPWARIELADFLKRRQDRNQPAIEVYHEVLRRDPLFVRPHVELCQLYTRIDEHPLAAQEAKLARERYRTAGGKGGEAQALLCAAEEQRKQAGPQLAEARKSVENARQLFEVLDQPYNLARAHFYGGLVEYSAGRLAEATSAFGDAAERLGATGNRALQGVALMNLGAISFQLGQPTPALDFFQRGRDVFLEIGDERRAAEADINGGGVQVEFGVDPVETLRRAANARATLERLGYGAFELLATRNEAEGHRYAGRLVRARTLLQSAFERARSRGLTASMDNLALALAQADIEDGDYPQARASLERVAASGGGAALEARIALGMALARLGEFARAGEVLRKALGDLEAQQFLGLRPMAHLALGQMANDMGEYAEARQQFDAAIAGWRDPLANAYAVEARCERGVADGRRGRLAASIVEIERGIVQASRVGRLSVGTRCRVDLARVHLLRQHAGEALKALAGIAEDTDDVRVGRELRAEVEYWRSEALAMAHAPESERHAQRARALLASIQERWSVEERRRYLARVEMSRIVQSAVSR